MSRSINNYDADWRREWDEEQRLTPEEQAQDDAARREEERIFFDLMACIDEIEREDYREQCRIEREEEAQRQWEEHARELDYEDARDEMIEACRVPREYFGAIDGLKSR